MFHRVAGLAFAMLSLGAAAQSWPQRPVTIVVPYGAGGNTDLIARMTAAHLSQTLGQSVVVENRVGAGGLVAAKAVLAAPADGYTLFMGTASQLVTSPHINPNITYDALKDFEPIINMGANAFVITVNSQLPVKTLPEFVTYAKQQTGKVNYGSGGMGGVTHLASHLFSRRADVDMTHIPYKGAAAAMADLLGGQIDMYSASPSEIISHINNGKIRPLAISSAQRLKELPDVPTIAETFPDHEVLSWNGLLAKTGTPPEILDRVASEVAEMQKDPAIQKKLVDAGIAPLYIARAAFGAQIQKEYAMWAPVLKNSGIRMN
ncbi:tripartite tricarboxylate transporter substrate binding protein [Pantoea sp. 18069]|uniref:Bug family tripartite tricarboxylate transporter substrate binding protein n=1 Tax=Pantoea sp. 18069 TaxID=2681415 RepID=UPI00135C306A|nr:tripartite tricarboxylate transporter substrate binding protein [Pantoea sp. 18069]